MCTRVPPLPGLSWGWGWGAGGPWAVERFLSGQEDDPRRFGAPRPAGERHARLIGVLEGSPTPRAALSSCRSSNGLQARRRLLWGLAGGILWGARAIGAACAPG